MPLQNLPKFEPKRVNAPSKAEFLGQYAQLATPVVITGVVDQWKASRLWTDPYLSVKLQGRLFLLNKCTDGHFGIFSSRMQDTDGCRIASFSEIASLMGETGGGDIHYMQQKSVAESLPELLSDVDYPTFVDRVLLHEVNFWLSQQSSAIPLHYDTFDNLLAQVRGSKRVMLYRPEEYANLYPGRQGAEFASKVDVHAPDLFRFPLFARAWAEYEFSLSQGEILYIPAFWWHYIVTESRCSLSLNFWYQLVFGHLREMYMLSTRGLSDALRHLRNLPGYQRRLAVERAACDLRQLQAEISNVPAGTYRGDADEENRFHA